MLGKLLVAAAAISAPGVAATVASERLVRPRLYYCGPWHPDPPDAIGVPYEEAEIVTADGLELQGWLFKPERPVATILFMHGTSYNASDMWLTPEREEGFREFLHGVRCNFLVFDYRGYGRNAGRPNEEGTYLDAAAALAWLHNRDDIDPATIFFYGFSLGTGIAAGLAAREPGPGLILRAPFTSVRDMIIDRIPRARHVFTAMPWLPLDNYDTLAKVRRLDRPLLVMHGDADTTVPEYMGQRVFEAAPGPKMYVTFPDADHSDIRNDLVVPAVRQFVDDVLAGRLGTATHEALHAAG